MLLFVVGAAPTDAEAPEFRDAAEAPLSDFVSAKAPWRRIEAGSEQMPPLYLGASPRTMATGGKDAEAPRIRRSLKALGESHASVLKEKLGLEAVELEAWPVAHWRGYWTWAFARYRATPDEPWRWIPTSFARRSDFESPMPELPAHYLPWKKSGDEAAVFRDFLESSDLYDKPRFGECVWTDGTGARVAAAWLPTDEASARHDDFIARKYHAYAIPQPARFNGRAITFVVGVRGGAVTWPDAIRWIDVDEPSAEPLPLPAQVTDWPEDFEKRYREDVAILAGEKTAEFPFSGRRERFTRKSCAQADHQLGTLVEYLEERYRELGIETHRQEFSWRGIRQMNLVARIPGRLRGEANRPILVGDHIDTVFAEDTFEATGERVTGPGADDNVSATAALLRAAPLAAALAKKGKLAHDVWLVHFTGEEFPADCLGARRFVEKLLADGREIGGLVLMDMIGYRKGRDPIFQVNAGLGAESVRLARVMLAAAADVAPELTPAFRWRFSDKSYLYNTDGIIFSDVGYPVVFIDEHINAQHMQHPHYHQSTDLSENVDFEYATALAKVAIETALRLAGAPASR